MTPSLTDPDTVPVPWTEEHHLSMRLAARADDVAALRRAAGVAGELCARAVLGGDTVYAPVYARRCEVLTHAADERQVGRL